MKYIGQDPAALNQFAQAVADGAISAGDTCLINSDGTISPVFETTQTEAVASAVNFDNNESGELFTVIKDPTQDKFAIIYQHNDGFQSNDNDKYIAFASISGTTITVGTPISFATQATEYDYQRAEYTDDGTILYCRRVDGGVGTVLKAMVLTPDYDANTVSKGTEITVSSTSTNLQQGSALSKGASNKFVTYYTYSPDAGFKCKVLTVSGTSVSAGSEVTVDSNSVDYFNATYDTTNGKHVVSYKDNGNSGYGTVRVGTVSGTSISFGTKVAVNSTAMYSFNRLYANTIYISSLGKLAWMFYENSLTKVYIGEVSGTSTTGWTGSSTGVLGRNAAIAYDANAQKIVLSYYLSSPVGSYIQSGSISGSTVTFDTRISDGFSPLPDDEGCGLLYDSASKKVVVVNSKLNNTTPLYPSAVVYSTGFTQTNLTSENFIGFADKDYADGADAVIQAKGAVNDKQTSLTAGQSYFVQTDGTLGTTADDPSVFAGTAVSATQLIVKG